MSGVHSGLLEKIRIFFFVAASSKLESLKARLTKLGDLLVGLGLFIGHEVLSSGKEWMLADVA